MRQPSQVKWSTATVSDTRTLKDLFAYNAWAHAVMFAVCGEREQAHLEAAAPGTLGTITETIKHMIGVEDVYAAMLRGRQIDEAGSREEYYNHDIAWYSERAVHLGTTYQDLLDQATSAFYDEPLQIPWFDFALTKHDGLLQVLSHSAQHRAQVLSALGALGVHVPDVDYVQFVQQRQGTSQQ